MATSKPRINITADPDIESALKEVAERDGVPVATKAAELIFIALSLEEDIGLAQMADVRKAIKTTYISHDKAWV